MKSPKQTKKVVKAFVAVATTEKFCSLFGFSDMDMAGVAKTKKELNSLYSSEFKIIPCTITYSLPKKKK